MQSIFQRQATKQCGFQCFRLLALPLATVAQAAPSLVLRPPGVLQRFSDVRLDGFALHRTACPDCPDFV